MKSLLLVAATVGFAAISYVDCAGDYYNYYQWKTVEYDLPSNVKLNSSEFIQKNNIIATLRIYGKRMWITTPRFRSGVPSTLNTVPYDRLRYDFFGMGGFVSGTDSPKLKPFPSYEMNKLGDCNSLQLVASMETDQYGRLWVVDVGRTNILDEILGEGPAMNNCPAKLVVFDVSNERSNQLFTYTFPDEVASRNSTILKDLQVACTSPEDCWVYISDLAASRLVVYDHKNKRSWTAQHPSMAPDPSKMNFTINGEPTSVAFGLTGLGLAPRRFKFDYLLFSPVASTTLYRVVNTSSLQNPALQQNGTLNQNDVIAYGQKPGQSDGLAMTSTGKLYYGDLPDSSVLYTQTSPEIMQLQGEQKAAQSTKDLLWPDTFSFDGQGKLLLTTSKFHLWLAGKLNYNDFNYRVVVLKSKDKLFAYNS